MFDRIGVHFYIAIAWLLLFLLMWFIFQFYILNTTQLIKYLGDIEENIKDENWSAASSNLDRLDKGWQQKKMGIQFNNGIPIVTSFERTMGELVTAIKHQDDDALQYIGGLRQDLKSLSNVFPGP